MPVGIRQNLRVELKQGYQEKIRKNSEGKLWEILESFPKHFSEKFPERNPKKISVEICVEEILKINNSVQSFRIFGEFHI